MIPGGHIVEEPIERSISDNTRTHTACFYRAQPTAKKKNNAKKEAKNDEKENKVIPSRIETRQRENNSMRGEHTNAQIVKS